MWFNHRKEANLLGAKTGTDKSKRIILDRLKKKSKKNSMEKSGLQVKDDFSTFIQCFAYNLTSNTPRFSFSMSLGLVCFRR